MTTVPFLTRNDRAERQRRIARMMRAGRPVEQVAEYFGITVDWARKVARDHGVSHPVGRRRKGAQEQRTEGARP